MRSDHFGYEVVELLPDVIEEGVLYVSLEYLTSVHRCCCGCGERVVTPIGPTDWSVTFHGDTVSLHPSIGNWGLACSSHYVLRRGRVEWAGKWSRDRIEAGRRAEFVAKERLYDRTSAEPESLHTPPLARLRWWIRLLKRAGNRRAPGS